MNLRILSRVVIYNPNNKKILLVKNRDEDFWYPPGGAWDYDKENILECAKRETYEETGLNINIKKLIYLQEFHPKKNLVFLEIFWFAIPIGRKTIDKRHRDLDKKGMVEKAKWFSKQELKSIKVFPKRLRETFWKNIKNLLNQKKENSFIGIS